MSIKIKQKVQAGFTLLEVMIALAIFSIGMLGIAGMQARGIQSTGFSQFRTIAIIQSYDMAERIQANITGARAGLYNDLAPVIVGGLDCVNAQCSSAQFATFDHFEWNTVNNAVLPSGRGSVIGAPTPTGGITFTITVMWDEDRSGVVGTGCSGDPSVDLKCYTTTFEI